MEQAVPLIDFFFERLMKTYDVRSVEGKVKMAKEGVALLGKIPDRIRRDFYTKALAERLDVKESFLHEMLRSSPKERRQRRREFRRVIRGKDFSEVRRDGGPPHGSPSRSHPDHLTERAS